ncbi:MAG: ethylbenzene dehydrogenase-related protein [Pseudomonadota bacterium]
MKTSKLTAALWAAAIGMAALPAAAQQALEAGRFAEPGPLLDPDAAVWQSAREVSVTMLPQNVATPMHLNAAVKELKVKAAHNGQWLALRLEWKDPTRNDTMVTDQFGDQVAVELPLDAKPDALPSPMMGHKGGRVNILQWRAPFQRDMEKGEPDVKTLYPNAHADLYPDQVLRVTDARPYMGALGVDNPVSRPKQSPVLDQMAEGWGTMTVKPDQHADGKGVWENGTWKVVITLPLVSGGSNAPRLAPGDTTAVAFAVWEGGNQEVGARKAWSHWVPLQLAK